MTHTRHRSALRRAAGIVAVLALGPLLAWALPSAVGSAWAHHPPLHTLIGTLVVVVAALVCAIGWNAYRRSLPSYLVTLALVFLGVALLDFSHLLSYTGMPDDATPRGPDKSVYFWLCARLLASLALLAVAIAPWRRFKRAATRYLLLAGVLAATALAHGLILFRPDLLPPTVLPAGGAAHVRMGMEGLLVVLNLATAGLLWRRMRKPEPFPAAALFAAACTLALGGLMLTRNAGAAADGYTLMAHLYEAIAYLLVYRAIFVETVDRPYRQLQNTESRLRATFQSIPDLMWVKDLDGIYLDCNPAFERLCRKSRDQIIGGTDLGLAAADMLPTIRARDLQVIAEGRTAVNEQWLNFEGAGYRGLFETVRTPMRNAQGRVIGVLGITRDITETRQALEALRVSEQRVNQAVRVARIGIFEHDQATGTIHWSPELREFYGFSPDEVVTMAAVVACIVPADYARLKPRLDRALDPAGDGLLEVEYRITRRDGTPRHLNMRASTLFSGEGPERRAVRLVGAVIDITERKQADAERRSLEAQLRESQKMESIGTLAGGIAHDFNNILGAILGNVALARGDLPPEHAALTSLEQINRAAMRARDLVQQILTFSRRQPQALVCQPLQPLVDEALALLRATLPARVRLETRITPMPIHLNADATQIEQILMNLCTNAWHALQGSTGAVTVGLEEQDLGADEAAALGALPLGPYAHLWVADTGSGMDAATRARIFEPFFTTKGPGHGTGLGLSVVHGIVTAHHGAITVASTPGQGSTFHLYFPAVPAPEGAAAVALAPQPKGQGEHVLYVDDDEVMLLMVERLLQRAGYRVTCCRSPQEALATVRAKPSDVAAVVTDFNMPGGSGLELAQALAELRPELPVVISSGYIADELRHDAERVGVRHLLQKQNTVDDLVHIVHGILAARGPAPDPVSDPAEL